MCKKRPVGVRARGCSGRDRVPDRWAGTPCALRLLTSRAATVFGHREWTGSVSGQGRPGAGHAAAVPVALHWCIQPASIARASRSVPRSGNCQRLSNITPFPLPLYVHECDPSKAGLVRKMLINAQGRRRARVRGARTAALPPCRTDGHRIWMRCAVM